jgi:hypothetical protein
MDHNIAHIKMVVKGAIHEFWVQKSMGFTILIFL